MPHIMSNLLVVFQCTNFLPHPFSANDTLNSSINDEADEFVPPPFTVDYDAKPGFRDAELVEQPMEARGLEISGLCSIM